MFFFPFVRIALCQHLISFFFLSLVFFSEVFYTSNDTVLIIVFMGIASLIYDVLISQRLS